jgi:hypothetical protein
MAGNIAGMFQQLNNAITSGGQAERGQGYIDSMSQGFGNVAAGVGNMMQPAPQLNMAVPGDGGAALSANPTPIDPYSFMTEGAKQAQGKQDLGKINLESSMGLSEAATIYGKMGEMDNQMAAATAARAQKASELKLTQEQQLRESLTKSALGYGLTDYAEQIATGAVDLKDAGEAMREQETNKMLLERGTLGRQVVAQRAGINKEQFEELNLGTMDEDQFKNFTQGLEGKVAHYSTADGKPSSIRTNKYGQVWNKEAQKWMSPSEMGLSAAPQLTKVHNVSNKMVDELAMQGVENFNELYDRANDAVITMDNIGRNLPLIDKMPTGTLAQVELFGRKVGELLGMNYDEAANAEVFQADAAQRVAKEIKAFGSGTGLSDKDREYTEKMAAGDINATPEALKRILRIRNDVAQGTIDNFHSVKARTRKTLGPQGTVLDMYELRAPAKPAGGLSTNALKYFGAPQ